MGAAASISMLYEDADGWFRAYIDGESFQDDFRAIDSNGDGKISLEDLIEYISKESVNNKHWAIFMKSPQIIDLAYQSACHEEVSPTHDQPPPVLVPAAHSRTIAFQQFRSLLLHMYVNSMLWAHFRNALVGHEGRLDFEGFKLACYTLSESRGIPPPTNEQLVADFRLVDVKKRNSVSFSEVCNFCYRCIHGYFEVKLEQPLTSDLISPATLILKRTFAAKTIPKHSIAGFLSGVMKTIAGSRRNLLETASSMDAELEINNAITALNEMSHANKVISRTIAKRMETQTHGETTRPTLEELPSLLNPDDRMSSGDTMNFVE